MITYLTTIFGGIVLVAILVISLPYALDAILWYYDRRLIQEAKRLGLYTSYNDNLKTKLQELKSAKESGSSNQPKTNKSKVPKGYRLNSIGQPVKESKGAK